MATLLNPVSILGRTTTDKLELVRISNDGRLEIGLPLAAFGEVLTAALSPILQGSFESTVLNTDLNTNVVTNTGTVTQGNAMALVGTGTTTNSTAELRSYHSAKYHAGMGGLARFTAKFTTPIANTLQYFGITDERGSSATYKNGYTIGATGALLSIQRWQNDVLIPVERADWDDKLDGTGASGITLDPTKLNVFSIRYQYLGAGAIDFNIEDSTTGALIRFHKIKYTNLNTVPSTFNPNYKFTIFSSNGSTTSNIIASSASYGFFVEGYTNYKELHQPQFATGTRQKTSVTTEVAILTIRNKTTYPASLPKTNFITILLERLSCSIDNNGTTNLAEIRLTRNATLGGTPSYADINASNSCVSIDTAGTTVTGGTTILVLDLTGKNDSKQENLTDYTIFLSPGETITISGKSAASATMNARILWKELV
jgi:hypothetical protein